MNHLELFSGTHSFGKVSSKLGYNVVSLDRDLGAKCPFTDYESKTHIMEDIMTWNYKIYKPNHFKLITASPVCLWWSNLRQCWIGRKCPKIHPTEIITKEILENDIEKFGKPMVDKVFEIIDYFNPQYYIIENPATGQMVNYINDLIPFYDIDYCKYSNWGYKKKTRFWTNIEGFTPKLCQNDCENMMTVPTIKGDKHPRGELIIGETRTLHQAPIGKNMTKHKKGFGGSGQFCVGGGNYRLERYRIPEKLIMELLPQNSA